MGHKINLNGTVYEITKGKTKAGGVVRDLLHGITADPVTGETKKIMFGKQTATVAITRTNIVFGWRVTWVEKNQDLDNGTYEIPIGDTLYLAASSRIDVNGTNVGSNYNLVVAENINITVTILLNAYQSWIKVTTGGAG